MAVLFPKIPALLHGGDYNPDQWLDRPDILKEDIRMMKKAGINTATLGVFAWSAYEPDEGKYNFGWLHDIMDELYENGIHTVLATPRGLIAFLENNVNADGTVNIPEALRPYMGGVSKIG